MLNIYVKYADDALTVCALQNTRELQYDFQRHLFISHTFVSRPNADRRAQKLISRVARVQKCHC